MNTVRCTRRLVCCVNRECKREAPPAAGVALGPDPPTMRLDDGTAYRQTDTLSPTFAVTNGSKRRPRTAGATPLPVSEILPLTTYPMPSVSSFFVSTVNSRSSVVDIASIAPLSSIVMIASGTVSRIGRTRASWSCERASGSSVGGPYPAASLIRVADGCRVADGHVYLIGRLSVTLSNRAIKRTLPARGRGY